MRKSLSFIAAFIGVCLSYARADALTAANPMTVIRVHAERVQFYYDRFLLEADGNVRVETTDGATMSGDAFSMDLKLNRFVLAGHVHVRSAYGSQDGAALADFLDFNRMYFVPLSGSQTPDRWTFLNGDFSHPAKGREMPGDTFFLPDLGNDQPFIVTNSAIIGTRSYVRFPGNRVDILNGLGAYVPTPSYYVNFSSDEHLGENSLAGASVDATYDFAGNANAISALHFRYDPTNKAYLSFEQHLSGSKAYAVFSINPLTRPQKYWDLLTSYRLSERFQIRTFSQLSTYQHGLSQPSSSSQFTTVQLTQALPHSFLQLNTQLTNYSMLGSPAGIQRLHPFATQLTAQTFSNRIGNLPLYESLIYGLGYQHDTFGLQTVGGIVYRSIWQHNLGAQLYLSALKLGNSAIDTHNFYVNATFQKNRTWNSSGHYVDDAQSTISLSRSLNRHVLAFASYSVQNIGDYYGALQSMVYPSFVPVVGGVPVYSYAAFNGVATLRTTSINVNYSNAGNFTASILARKHADFPKPFPGLFPTPALNVLGQQQVTNYLGEPPYDITADIRARINPTMSIDVARSYYFNFGNQRWSPTFVVQVMQQ
jgi:hypothetical protein